MAVNINVPSQVKTYANLAAFPASGALKTIYIAEDTNKTYRWTGSVYVEVSASASGITIGTTAITSGTVGRVLFEGTGNVVQQSSSLFWDATNNRLGIGTSSPTNDVSIYGDTNGVVRTRIENISTGTNASADIYIRNSVGGAAFQVIGTGNTVPSVTANQVRLRVDASVTNGFYIATGGSTPIRLATNDTERLQINGSTGNVLINTTTDAGFRLDVNGTARVQGALTTTGAISAGANTIGRTDFGQGMQLGGGTTGEFRFINSTGAGYFYTWYNQNVERMRFSANNNLLINTTTDAGFRLDVNGTARVSGNATVSLNQNGATELNVSNTNNSAASQTLIRISSSSGSGLIGRYSASTTPYKTLLANDTFFYSAGTSDISFLNDFASGRIKFAAGGVSTPQMILKASGVLNLSSVPTSATGLSAGDIWNDGGTLKIV